MGFHCTPKKTYMLFSELCNGNCQLVEILLFRIMIVDNNNNSNNNNNNTLYL